MGASHQTGWTGIVDRAMHLFATTTSEQALQLGKAAAVAEVERTTGAQTGQHVAPGLEAEMRRRSNPASAWAPHHVFERGESKVLKRIATGLISLLWLITFAAINSPADDLFIYPGKNQSAEQQDKDKWECRAWATSTTLSEPVNL
jgi:hypothetical protein